MFLRVEDESQKAESEQRAKDGRRRTKDFLLYFCDVTNKKSALISTKGANL
jgi:hypothetical protein